MIIDLHRHLWSVVERYASVRREAARSSVQVLDAETEQRIGTGGVPDVGSRGARIIAEMDAAGIDMSVVFLGDYGLRLGESALSVEDENRAIADLARRHPSRIVPFAGVDPRRPQALELFRQGLDDWGMRGLKLHPGTGFDPAAEVCRPFFELAGTRGVPVVVHTGPMASPLVSNTARPVNLDPVAADFPDTTIVMQHAGQRAWWEEALNIAFWKPNVYLELSMWQWAYQFDRLGFVKALGRMKQEIGLDRVLFGSDFPGLAETMGLRAWVEVFLDLPELASEHGVDIARAEAEAILGGNAQRILGLDGGPQ